MKKLLLFSLLLGSWTVNAKQDSQEQPRKHARRYALAPDPEDNYHYYAYRDEPTPGKQKKKTPTKQLLNNPEDDPTIMKYKSPTATEKRFSLFG